MIEKIKIAGKEYPIAFNMLAFSRITKHLGADNFSELFTKVQAFQNIDGVDALSAMAEVLEPMSTIAHYGLYTGGVLSGDIYKHSMDETQSLFTNFDEVIECFTLFMSQFESFFMKNPNETENEAETATKKKVKTNP